MNSTCFTLLLPGLLIAFQAVAQPNPEKNAGTELTVLTETLGLSGPQQDRLLPVLKTFHDTAAKARPESGPGTGNGRPQGGPPSGGMRRQDGGMGRPEGGEGRMPKAVQEAMTLKNDSLKVILTPEQWKTFQENQKSIRMMIMERLRENP